MVSLSEGAFDCPAFTKTSYASEFMLPERQPTTRFHNFVSLVSNTNDKLVPRCFPHFALHVSPHRILDCERSALGFGPTGAEYVETDQSEKREADAGENEGSSKNSLGTARSESGQQKSKQKCSARQEKEKDLSKSLQNGDSQILENMAPRQKFDLPKCVLDEVTANIYKTTAQRASEECTLPIRERPLVLTSIIGSNEDRELYHSVYQRTGTWKTNVVPENWERAQERPLYEDPKAKQYRPCRLSKSKARLLSKRLQRPNEIAVAKSEGPKSLPSPIKHIRPSPGNAGLVPKLPVIPSPPRDPRLMLSTSAATYSKSKTRLLSKRLQRPNEIAVAKIEGPKSLPSPIKHIRPSPGYAGFVPKLPVIPSPRHDPRLMLSTSAATYRHMPRENLHILENAHKGPLSKLVTTTTPCNPFNKTTQMSQQTSGYFVI